MHVVVELNAVVLVLVESKTRININMAWSEENRQKKYTLLSASVRAECARTRRRAISFEFAAHIEDKNSHFVCSCCCCP